MTKPNVYIETSIVSYLTANPSRDVTTFVRQQSTIEWWNLRRQNYDVRISQFVVDESSKGDATQAQERLVAIDGFPLLDFNDEAKTLVAELTDKILPLKAEIDAAHIAIAIVHQVDYLLTWNMKHIANAIVCKRIEKFCREVGYEFPTICTPDAMLGE
ncbi:MAG: type II toxin-antitoxin system VapC family toxin [Pyrinomonadaceae bacterium MAG19_C2-C3]|nr:type II toxin-antitoxin system VapC family toxin [Pyrinomonadaceae bacterium MAG19_C2-C3]